MTVGWPQRTLLVGGTIYSPSDPFATAMLIDGDTIAWIGEDTAADVHRDGVHQVIDLEGRFVAPGFVDAHVHATSTGLLLDGLNLTGAVSREAALALIADSCRASGAQDVVIGHGWDETSWSGDQESRRVPTRAEIDEIAGGRCVYLSRIDVHSALVSSALIAQAPQAQALDGFDDRLPVSRQAHMALRDAALAAVGNDHRTRAHRRVLDHASRQGLVCLHENAGPAISSESDLGALLGLAATEPGPIVVGYWAELARDGGLERARALGALGVAGDLFVDGAIGSRTACLCSPYTDAADTTGAAYLTPQEVADHISAATLAGMQAGFHVIGDRACATVAAGLRLAADAVGADRIRAASHRLEHAEMLSDADVSTMRELGVIASMQPLFDDMWGGESGMYVERLGFDRALHMNRFADLISAGVALAFGSDAPVTAMEPWAAVRAATLHRTPAQRISARAAFAAHTRGGWRAMREPGGGVLAPGAPAHLAIWEVDELDVQVPDERLRSWSTDPRSATAPLPLLADDLPLPACVSTMVGGRLTYTDESLPWSAT